MPLTSNTCWETHMSTMCFSLCWPHNWLQHLGQVNSFLALYSGGELLACVPTLMGTQVGPLNLEPTYGPWPQHPLNSAGPDTDTAPPRGWAVLGPCGWPPGWCLVQTHCFSTWQAEDTEEGHRALICLHATQWCVQFGHVLHVIPWGGISLQKML